MDGDRLGGRGHVACVRRRGAELAPPDADIVLLHVTGGELAAPRTARSRACSAEVGAARTRRPVDALSPRPSPACWTAPRSGWAAPATTSSATGRVEREVVRGAEDATC